MRGEPAESELWLTIWWRDDVLIFRRLDDDASFVLGEEGADFPFPASVLGVGCATLVSRERGETALHLLDAFDDDSELYFGDEVRSARALRREGIRRIAVGVGFDASLVLGDFSIHLACEPRETLVTPRIVFDGRLYAVQSAVGLATLACLVMSSQLQRAPWDREAEREALARQYLLRAHDADAEILAGDDRATRAAREGGRSRYAVSGPRDAAEFGMIGLLASGAAPEPARSAGIAGERFHAPADPRTDPVSTFAVDVDTGAYSLARRSLAEGDLPAPASVRVEEFLNYFDYRYPDPDGQPLAANVAAAPSPYEAGHYLVRVGIQARRISSGTPRHLVYLVDTSGSMSSGDKIGLAQRSLKLLTDALRPHDTVALCTYAGDVREVLPPTRAGDRARIHAAIDALTSGGGTAMGSGIDLAYRLASVTAKPGSITRVIVLSDGDANIGPTSHEQILDTIRSYRGKGITLSTVGFGRGNYNDVMMEQLADAGDGNYSYIDSEDEARRVFVERMDELLEVVARDVKVQVAFDPSIVASYRLIGYENRDVADADFRRDEVDAGEVGAGHEVTAVYDVVLRDVQYASQRPWLTVHLRHKPAAGDTAVEHAYALGAEAIAPAFADAPADLRFAAAVAGFAEILRQSPYAEGWTLADVAEVAAGAQDGSPARAELLALIERAHALR